MQYTEEELNRILEDHEMWLKGEGGRRANLNNADLRDADLMGADLNYANLSYANLRGADLRGADLRGANLNYANLNNADLRDADLMGANLIGANLSGADLSGADLNYADLSGANLIDANLSGANLIGANLIGANLSGADLSGADLSGANLIDANLIKSVIDESEKIRKGIILEEPMIGYKKCHTHIVTLEIPVGAIVFSINNGKCRTNKAKVLAISDRLDEVASNWDDKFIYRIGEEKTIKDFDMMYNIECSTGIHFFRTKEETENYQ